MIDGVNPSQKHGEKTVENLDPRPSGMDFDQMFDTNSGWWLGHPSEKYESQLG